MKSSVFDFDDYKKYLKAKLPTSGEYRGLRAKLAEVLSCQGAYISHVLNTSTNFSLEHSVLIDQFLGHSSDESHYFILLVQFARAGSKVLETYFLNQLIAAQKNRQVVAERIKGKQSISEENHNKYYSAWYISAIHTITLIPEYQTKNKIAEYFKLPMSLISETLEFLISIGLVEENSGQYLSTTTRTHLGQDSISISKHHTNWRIQAIQSLDKKNQEDLHYSGPIAISHKNAQVLRKILLATIDQMEPVIAETSEELPMCLCLDLFKL
jgi:uncharacterized protein (TIGR02147 family)